MKPSPGHLTTHAIWKWYRGRAVVQAVSIDVQAGEIVGLLGPNGAGKTTTFYNGRGSDSPGQRRRVSGGEGADASADAPAGAPGDRFICRRKPPSFAK